MLQVSAKKKTVSNRTPRFYEQVFVLTYNLFWIIRVKVEVLMEVTIHIYCLIIFALSLLSAQGGTAEAREWRVSTSVFVFMIYYLFRTVHWFHLKSVYFCILFSTLRELFGSRARNAVNIMEMLECCVALDLALHTLLSWCKYGNHQSHSPV